MLQSFIIHGERFFIYLLFLYFVHLFKRQGIFITQKNFNRIFLRNKEGNPANTLLSLKYLESSEKIGQSGPLSNLSWDPIC